MKTAKPFFILCIALGSAMAAHAQMYINLGGGFGFPANKELITVSDNITQTNETYTGVYSSLGIGGNGSLILGYMLCENGGLEVGYSYFNSMEVSSRYENSSVPGVNQTGSDEFDAVMNRIYLGGRFTCGENRIKPYMRGGLVLGVGNKIGYGHYRYVQSTSSTQRDERVLEYDGGLAFGYTASIGLNFMFSDNLGMYLEACDIAQRWAPTHSIYTRYDIDGQDQLGNMTTRQKETNYMDEVVVTSSPDDNKPDEDLKMYWPFSSIGIQAGVTFMLGGK